MKIFTTFLICFLSHVPFLVIAQNINYFGVAYSPYVKQSGYWNSYSIDDIKKMLRIMLDQHNAVTTYSMGLNGKEAE